MIKFLFLALLGWLIFRFGLALFKVMRFLKANPEIRNAFKKRKEGDINVVFPKQKNTKKADDDGEYAPFEEV